METTPSVRCGDDSVTMKGATLEGRFGAKCWATGDG